MDFFQEDYTEFTDFPSFEDLDAFLADTRNSIVEMYCRKHRRRLLMLWGPLTRLNFNQR